MKNESLLDQLRESISHINSIKSQLAKELISYENDLNEAITRASKLTYLKHDKGLYAKGSQTLLANEIHLLKNMLKKFDKALTKEVHTIETEMAGTRSFSEEEKQKIETYALKKNLKDELGKTLSMLDLMYRGTSLMREDTLLSQTQKKRRP